MSEDIPQVSSGIPVDQTTEITISNPTLDICAFDCKEQNVKRCRKCNRPFCIMHANHFSPNFCKDCFKDIAIVADKFKRTFDEIGDNGQLYHRTEERIRYYMDGPDWPFVTPWIDSLSDEQLEIMWIFHHFVLRIIESENDTRKVERSRILREHPVPKLITQTTSKRVTKVAAPVTLEDLKKQWAKTLPKDVVDMMVKAYESGNKP